MILITDEQTARERARQAGTFKFWSLGQPRSIGLREVWQTLGYCIDEQVVHDWANAQITACRPFRIYACQYIGNQWQWS
jgi:hypothetical protein